MFHYNTHVLCGINAEYMGIVMEHIERSTPLNLDDTSLSMNFKLLTILRISYLVKYLSVLSIDRPGSPYFLCDFSPSRFIMVNGTIPKMIHVGGLIPLSRTLKCQSFPPRLTRDPIYVHRRAWFLKHCDQPKQHICEQGGCLSQWSNEMSEFECGEDGRCPGIGISANVFSLGRAFIRPLIQQYPNYTPLMELANSTTNYLEKNRPGIDEVIYKLSDMVKDTLK
eukprot:NODE_7493_length_773_cov_7.556923_g6882_i0.p1 GENE.NODE_7493_length_773_cov_7.556923_g6882_i0~~NODE_7493_length_773_cov_7.556923_g6882_i0.p1  ORF type:complete len:224 (-),score=31.35 NODE_7493_length_773_cov_7.556923_g6882_i0:100-771(-)